ncbi:hypothetical protein DWX59_10105 [Enterocloster aldenensis]|nr:hypothetical protein DWX59_10105 [Enterocloster aldenensis]
MRQTLNVGLRGGQQTGLADAAQTGSPNVRLQHETDMTGRPTCHGWAFARDSIYLSKYNEWTLSVYNLLFYIKRRGIL